MILLVIAIRAVSQRVESTESPHAAELGEFFGRAIYGAFLVA